MATPLIDNLATVPYSTKKGAVRVLPSGTFSADLINALAQFLPFCGWTLANILTPTCIISYPFGFTFAPGSGSGIQGCSGNWVVINTPTKSYRFSSYSPGWTTSPGNCIFFELGSTPALSLASLCAAITAYTPYTATLTGSGPAYVVTLTANLPGPTRNFDTVAADGRYGITSGLVTGGGFTLDSVGSSPYSVDLIGDLVGVNTQGVRFNFILGPSLSSGPANFVIETDGSSAMNVVADPYSFALWDEGNNNNSIASFAPCVPTSEGFSAAYCVFVIGPGNLTFQLMWQGSRIGQPCSVALNRSPISLADSLRGPQVCVPRVGGFPGLTLDNQPLTTAAFAMMADNFGATPAVVGKLWDCIVQTQTATLGSTIVFGGRTFVCISSQAGSGVSSASLFFCINDSGQPSGGTGPPTNTGGSGPGGGTSPVNPGAPPGSGNGSLSGTCTDTNGGTTIEWASGDLFTSAMVGQTITLLLPVGSVLPFVTDSVTNAKPLIASFVNSTTVTVPNTLNSGFQGLSFTSP
jgi:hypothetical protein